MYPNSSTTLQNSTGDPLLRGPYWWKIIFFVTCFYAFMHGRTIVQNKIISIICSCLFFYLANIYRPSLGKVQFGWPNPNQSPSLNFYLKGKKNILHRIVSTTMLCRPIFSFHFHLFLKNIFKKCIKKDQNLSLYI